MLTGNSLALLGSIGTVSILVLFVLFVFSFISWGIIAYKWRLFKISDQDEAQFLHSYELQPHDLQKMRDTAETCSASSSAAVFLGVIDRWEAKRDFDNQPSEDVAFTMEPALPNRYYLEKVAQSIIQRQIGYQETYLPFLATTGNITPFIGLFGTVIGVINAFQEIGIQGSASIAVVAPGVAEALVATAAGLFAAIPAVIAYNYFLAKIRKTTFQVEAFSIEFLNDLIEQAKETREIRAIH